MVTVSLYHCHPVNAKQLPFLICFSNLFQPLLICFNFHRSSMLQLFVTQIVFNFRGCHKIQTKNHPKLSNLWITKGLQVEEDVDESRGKAEPLRPKWFQRKKRKFLGRFLEMDFFPAENFWVHPTHQPIPTALARRRSFTSQSLVTWLCIKATFGGIWSGPHGRWKELKNHALN